MNFNWNIQKTLLTNQSSFQLNLEYASSCQSIAIFGPSGAGKTTLIKIIAGLMIPDAGSITIKNNVFFDDKQKINLKPQQRNLAYFFQTYSLFPHLTVQQNIAFSLKKGFLNPCKHRYNTEVSELLEQFELSNLAHQYPHELSGGQQQRVALARALITKPKLLLLDEPFSMLDYQLRQRLRVEVKYIQQQINCLLLIISHDPEDINFFADDVLSLKNGKMER
ncbi:ABC transporter ATP-binding protein [Commensalibacter papalotli (ex Botero et al. 2024)]|uniref:ATPase component (CysA) n=1 Tax=Commensalibacter papalotli (ex Botero et al. 2024) TaxID=2972766 RepID=A0ABM9HQW8_9PROT|nr:ABC transporter ATP-binding protein [Commensalibacter papalotli (ex Botero et al. 2024)]CAI3943750.1 ABC-type sulfate/molybdate transport systems [Commensalibacter papalotli (ex Botero et al. 2024)]CAI3947143.1 ABC-type sulfate/molybdate transport systems [Commensalibacter papalotli (ex Botero et al. 2024)]